jgi:hypothetical protein
MCMQDQNIAKHTSTAGPQPCIAAASWQATHWRVIMTARVESRLAHTTTVLQDPSTVPRAPLLESSSLPIIHHASNLAST